MKYEFLNSLNLETDVSNKISRSLDNVMIGNRVPLRTPVASALSAEQVLSAWDSIYNAKSNVINSELNTIELSNRSKYGPRNLAIPWKEREEGVKSYFLPPKVSKVPDYSILFPQRLRPLSVENSSDYLKNDTNSGLPFMVRKGLVKMRTLNNFVSLLERNDPCVLFTRTQEGDKTRNVWGYPIVETLNEMRFYRPLLEYQRRLTWRSALFGPQAVDKSVTELIQYCTDRNLFLASIDFSSYDASVKFGLQLKAFDYIKSLFQKTYWDEIDQIFHKFNTIELITPSGILSGPHGVPSGSTFTNEVDSIVQYLCAKSYGIDNSSMNIQGDDGVYCVDDPYSLFSHFESYGLNVSSEKSLVSNNSVMYLQNYHSPDYVNDEGLFGGIYSTYRALGRIIFPERYDQFSDYGIEGADYYSIRTISILENCVNHPLFEDLVRYVSTIDKYSLKYSQKGLVRYCQLINQSQGSDEIRRYRRGDNVSGLNSFKTVKILSEL
jgi:hypothetical protein